MNAMRDRLRAHAETRLVAIPDTEGEVLAALGRLDELLGWVAAWQEPGGAGHFDAGPSWEAVRRLVSAVVVSVEAAEPPAQPLASDGRYELVPLAWAIV